MNYLSKTDSVKSPEIVDLLFCSVVSGCVPKVSFLLYRMMRSVFSEWAALPPVVLLIRWLAHRAGFGREAPVALGLQSTRLPWVPSLCPGLSFSRLFPVWSPRLRFSLLVPLIWWYCDRLRVHTFLLHLQFGSNSPCSPSPCGPGALCEVVIGSDEWTII